MKRKVYSSREFGKLLRENGYTYDRCKGDHVIYIKESRHICFTAKDLNRMVARRLIKEYNIIEY